MKKIPATVLLVCAVVLALWMAYCSGQRDGARTALAAQRDIHDDALVARLRQEVADSGKALDHERDSTGREIRSLQQRVARQTSPVATASGGTNSPAVAPSLMIPDSDLVSQLALRDSLIAALEAGRAQDSLEILFWRGQTAQRDTVIAQLQASRNTWRSRSERRFSCGVGAAVTVGLDGRAAVGPSVGCFYKL